MKAEIFHTSNDEPVHYVKEEIMFSFSLKYFLCSPLLSLKLNLYTHIHVYNQNVRCKQLVYTE